MYGYTDHEYDSNGNIYDIITMLLSIAGLASASSLARVPHAEAFATVRPPGASGQMLLVLRRIGWIYMEYGVVQKGSDVM